MTVWPNALKVTVKFTLIERLSVILLHPPKLQPHQSPFPLLFELILKPRAKQKVDKGK